MLAALLTAAPALVLLAALGAALAAHPYAAKIGWRYLRSKKRRSVSVITGIAVVAVALGVGALLVVMSITSGFQQEFRNKVLGVNAHVLVLKYGLDFEEYGMVVDRAREMPEVAGAAPFLINEMMLAKGDQISGVLVKGVDPELMPTVLDLPSQMVQGSLRGLRVAGAAPPERPEDSLGELDDDWDWLNRLGEGEAGDAGPIEDVPPLPEDAPDGGVANASDAGAAVAPDGEPEYALPEVDVPTPEEAEAALGEMPEMPELPDDALLDQMVEEDQDYLDGGDEDRELPGVIVGRTLAQNLGLGVGDEVQVISPLAGLDTSMFDQGSSHTPRSRSFRVIGIFEAGFQEYDSRLVYVDIYEAQHFFDHGDSVTGVEITLHDLEKAPEVSRRLERVLGGGPFHTMDWQELNHNLFTALEIQKVMISLVIATIIFVAAFVVIATLIMMVLEKKREIAILKAMGARSFGVLLIFVVQGIVIGLVGTLLGLVLGGGACLYLEVFEFALDPQVYLIDHLPVRTSLAEFVMTASVALAICMCATILPSWWASRMLPADGVRYE